MSVYRNRNCKGSSFADFAVDLDLAGMFSNNIVCNAQSKPCPFAHLFCGKKRLENPAYVFLRNS